MKYLTILGSTGSIGKATLNIIKNNNDKFVAYALVANTNVKLMTLQCLQFKPKYVCMVNNIAAIKLKNNLSINANVDTIVLSGIKYACELAKLDKIDIVMSAIVGIAGLKPTISALKAGKRVLLANKESLISCGNIFMKEISQNKSELFPVDSEHNAIIQLLPDDFSRKIGYKSILSYDISKIILTGSGGSSLNIPLKQLKFITPNKICNHPTWSMGNKISVDSATMINKGFEYIEACLLFGIPGNKIEILLHPQSIIHAMVEYKDGSTLAQLANPDMKMYISYAMSYPDRIKSTLTKLNINKLNMLTFTYPNTDRYPCLELAINAYKSGQSSITILNASNEISVIYFLKGIINFTDISIINKKVLDELSVKEPTSIEEIILINKYAKIFTKKIINKYFLINK